MTVPVIWNDPVNGIYFSNAAYNVLADNYSQSPSFPSGSIVVDSGGLLIEGDADLVHGSYPVSLNPSDFDTSMQLLAGTTGFTAIMEFTHNVLPGAGNVDLFIEDNVNGALYGQYVDDGAGTCYFNWSNFNGDNVQINANPTGQANQVVLRYVPGNNLTLSVNGSAIQSVPSDDEGLTNLFGTVYGSSQFPQPKWHLSFFAVYYPTDISDPNFPVYSIPGTRPPGPPSVTIRRFSSGIYRR